MDKLTELIKEAKPLYKKRKQQKRMAKAVILTVMPLMLFGSFFELYQEGNNLYASLENNSLQNELMQDDLGLLR